MSSPWVPMMLDDVCHAVFNRSTFLHLLKTAYERAERDVPVAPAVSDAEWMIGEDEVRANRHRIGELMRERSNGLRAPVVLRGLFADTPAVRTWTPHFFLEKAGDEPVDVVDHRTGKTESMPLRAVVHGHESLYLKFWPNLFRTFPELIDDLAYDQVFPEWIRGPGSSFDPFSAEFFMGVGYHPDQSYAGTSLHCAPHANVFCQVYGAKTWELCAPSQSAWLRPLMDGAAAISSLHRRTVLERGLINYKVVLQPGDGLLVPPWWWHQIENHGFCIGVASRDTMVLESIRNNPLFSLMRPKGAILAGLNRYLHFMSATNPPIGLGAGKSVRGLQDFHNPTRMRLRALCPTPAAAPLGAEAASPWPEATTEPVSPM